MIKTTGITRKVDELGRIVLPVETRQALGVGEQDGLEIFLDEENRRIVLEKATKLCMKCQSTVRLKEIKPGFYLCDDCISGLK